MRNNASSIQTLLSVAAVSALAWSCHRTTTTAEAPDASTSPVRAGAPSTETVGTIGGQVSWAGPSPPGEQVQTSPSVERVCGRTVLDRRLLVDAAGGLANVVVFLADLPPEAGGASPSQTVTVDQRGCSYLPAVVAARVGTTIEFLNSDALIHNVHAVKSSTPLFNFAMPLQGLRVQKRLPSGPGIVELRCDLHPWMHGVVRVFDHPYFALSDAQGRYRLAGIPSGSHKLVFWHERLRFRVRAVTVTPGRDLEQNVQWSMEDLSTRALSEADPE